MSDSSNLSIKGLILSIALICFAEAIHSLIYSGSSGVKTVRLFVLGSLLTLVCFSWSWIEKRAGEHFTQSARQLASSFKAWFVLIVLILIYSMVSNIMLINQGNRIAEVIDKDIIPFRKALQMWVVPRRLTPDQIRSVGDYLKKYPPSNVSFVVARHDEEASQFRADLSEALVNIAQWNISGIEYRNDVKPGLRIRSRLTRSTSSSNDPRNPRADELMEKAFRQAGIQVDGGGSGTGKDTVIDEYFIHVGSRRRDSHANPVRWPF